MNDRRTGTIIGWNRRRRREICGISRLLKPKAAKVWDDDGGWDLTTSRGTTTDDWKGEDERTTDDWKGEDEGRWIWTRGRERERGREKVWRVCEMREGRERGREKFWRVGVKWERGREEGLKPQQYIWSNQSKIFKKISSKPYCCGFLTKPQQYGYFIFFLFFLRDILLRMGKTAAISPQQLAIILLVKLR